MSLQTSCWQEVLSHYNFRPWAYLRPALWDPDQPDPDHLPPGEWIEWKIRSQLATSSDYFPSPSVICLLLKDRKPRNSQGFLNLSFCIIYADGNLGKAGINLYLSIHTHQSTPRSPSPAAADSVYHWLTRNRSKEILSGTPVRIIDTFCIRDITKQVGTQCLTTVINVLKAECCNANIYCILCTILHSNLYKCVNVNLKKVLIFMYYFGQRVL